MTKPIKFRNLQDVDDWVQNQKKLIRNPEDDPEIDEMDDSELELDEGQSGQLQLLYELEGILDRR